MAKAAIWDNTDAEEKAWGANRIRYPGSPRPKRCELDVGLNSEISVEANALSSPPGEYGRKTETQRN